MTREGVYRRKGPSENETNKILRMIQNSKSVDGVRLNVYTAESTGSLGGLGRLGECAENKN